MIRVSNLYALDAVALGTGLREVKGKIVSVLPMGKPYYYYVVYEEPEIAQGEETVEWVLYNLIKRVDPSISQENQEKLMKQLLNEVRDYRNTV